jgi:hypothetical protein
MDLKVALDASQLDGEKTCDKSSLEKALLASLRHMNSLPRAERLS